MFALENVSGDREQQFHSKNDFSKNSEIFDFFFGMKNIFQIRKINEILDYLERIHQNTYHFEGVCEFQIDFSQRRKFRKFLNFLKNHFLSKIVAPCHRTHFLEQTHSRTQLFSENVTGYCGFRYRVKKRDL